MAARSRSQEADDAAAPPDFGDVGQVQVVGIKLGVAQRRGFGIHGALLFAGIGVAEDVQPLRVGRHDAVFDAIVDHLDEVTRAARTAVQVAMFGSAAYLLPTGRTWRLIDTWSKGGEEEVETPDDDFIPTNHQAVAPLRPPDSAAGPDINVVNAFRFQLGGAANVIVVVGVAAVDNYVVVFEEWAEGLQRWIDHGRRHHHPDGAWLFQLMREVFERRRSDRPLFDECLYSFRLEVVNDALVAGPLKTPHHVGSHPAQSDHAQFHVVFLSLKNLNASLRRRLD